MLQVSADRLAQRRMTVLRTTIVVQQLWGRVDPDQITDSWGTVAPAVVQALTSGQEAAASGADDYVTAAVATAGATPARAGTVNTDALTGVASDGRPLRTLLDAAPLRMLRARSVGASPQEAKAAGLTKLIDLSATQVHDTGRLSDSVAMAADRTVTGYRRRLRTPSCSRCIVLAGRFYRWNTGFQRHPRCDCVHEPATKNDGGQVDPRDVFEQLPPEEQDRIFTKAGAEAIREGADVNQVVNARRGMKTTTAYGRKIQTTTVGTSARAQAGRRLRDAGVTRRLMPEQIFADAADRTDAIRLLRLHGYLT